MTDNQDLLAQLADIKEPEIVLGWQLAPGFWLLLAGLAGLLFWLSWRAYQCWRKRQPQRTAMQLLQQIDIAQPQAASEINMLLKRLLQTYQPAHPMLHAKIDAWQHYLQQQLPTHLPLPDLQRLLYQPASTASVVACEQWWHAAQYIVTHADPASGLTKPHRGAARV